MLSVVSSAGIAGIEGFIVSVECDAQERMATFEIVGLPDLAIREAKEEVGVDLDPAQGKLVESTVREHFQDIKDVWSFLYDGEIDLYNATTDEVADMRWMTVEEIRQLYDTGELVHTLGYFFDDPELGGQA